jgi:hypothetical protein
VTTRQVSRVTEEFKLYCVVKSLGHDDARDILTPPSIQLCHDGQFRPVYPYGENLVRRKHDLNQAEKGHTCSRDAVLAGGAKLSSVRGLGICDAMPPRSQKDILYHDANSAALTSVPTWCALTCLVTKQSSVTKWHRRIYAAITAARELYETRLVCISCHSNGRIIPCNSRGMPDVRLSNCYG